MVWLGTRPRWEWVGLPVSRFVRTSRRNTDAEAWGDAFGRIWPQAGRHVFIRRFAVPFVARRRMATRWGYGDVARERCALPMASLMQENPSRARRRVSPRLISPMSCGPSKTIPEISCTSVAPRRIF